MSSHGKDTLGIEDDFKVNEKAISKECKKNPDGSKIQVEEKTRHKKIKSITDEDIQEWKKEYDIILPSDSSYNTVRLNYNKLVQSFPTLIFYPHKRKEISFVLKKAKKYSLPLAIRCGGHDVLGYSLPMKPGMLIDVSHLTKVKVKESKELGLPKGAAIATVGAGCKNGQLAVDLAKYKKCLPSGTCSTVGIAIALGGGIGFLTRKYGFPLDNLTEVGLILASGSFVKATKDKHADLFWALCGAGGGNFGVVSHFKFVVYPIHDCVLFELWFAREHLQDVLHAFQDNAPYTDVNISTEVDVYHRDYHPAPIKVTGQYVGEEKACSALLQCYLRKLESPSSSGANSKETKEIKPVQSRIWTASWLESVKYFNGGQPLVGERNAVAFTKAASLFVKDKFDARALSAIEQFMDVATPGQSIEINALGGNLTSPINKDNCFPWRDSKMWLYIRGEYDDFSLNEAMESWVYGFYLAVSPGLKDSNTGLPMLYANFKLPLSLVGERYGDMYYGTNYDRLREIKTKYDPTNTFIFPQSIQILDISKTKTI